MAKKKDFGFLIIIESCCGWENGSIHKILKMTSDEIPRPVIARATGIGAENGIVLRHTRWEPIKLTRLEKAIYG